MEEILLDPELLHMLYKLQPQLLEHLDELEPDIYRRSDNVCCVSVCDGGIEINGYGRTIEYAIEEWERSYKKAYNVI